jgi:hypothetical protein
MSWSIRVAQVFVVLGALSLATSVGATEGPLWGKRWTGGQAFPLAFGVGVTLEEQRQEYGVDSIVVGLPGLESVDLSRLPVDGRQRSLELKLDAWLLPYLNAFVVAGRLDGRTVVDFGDVGAPRPIGRVSIAYDGQVYGGGATARWGTERAFASLTGVWTDTSLSGELDSSAERLTFSPRFGVHDGRGALWLGAAWQRSEESHRGALALPFVGRVPFFLELSEESEWNGLLGGNVALDTHWHLELEGGFGAREGASVTVSYRF